MVGNRPAWVLTVVAAPELWELQRPCRVNRQIAGKQEVQQQEKDELFAVLDSRVPGMAAFIQRQYDSSA
jgi:hypothetical protein